jgi:tetratricopeptide (TPR) repeat protein
MKAFRIVSYFFIGVSGSLITPQASAQGDGAIKPTGSFYALIIGESQYDNPKLALDRPAKDAQKFKDVLLSKYTFDDKNVKLLLNPSRQQIFAELYNLRKIITTNDNLLIFYAGHGYWDDQASQGYWWPRDAAITDPSNWLSNSDLKEQIRGIKTAHTLLISDACFSGGIFKTRSAAEAIRNSSVNIQMLYKMPSRRAMTSGTLTTVPDESVFFSYLIKRLSENTETFLPSEDLFNSLKQAVINNSMVVPQDGVIAESGDEGGDFIFILKDRSTSAAVVSAAASASTANVTRGIGPSADELIESGKSNLDSREFAKALNDYSQAISLDPKNAQAYNGRGKANLGMKKLEAAVDDFSKAIELKPDFAWAYCLRGQTRRELRKFNDAITDLSKAIEINPRYTYAYNFRGFAELDVQKYDAALDDFNKAVQLDVKYVFPYNGRGLAEIKLGKYDEAVADFSKAIEINPKFAVGYSNRGLARINQAKFDEATSDIAMAIQLDSKLAHAYTHRGLLEMKQNKLDDALADFSHVIELNPRPEAYLERARAYYAKKDIANAMNDVNKVLSQRPKNQEALALRDEIQKNK